MGWGVFGGIFSHVGCRLLSPTWRQHEPNSWRAHVPANFLHPEYQWPSSTSSRSLAQAGGGLLTTYVEMRKQCPSCLSNKDVAPLDRWGLLMRDKDCCPFALSFLPNTAEPSFREVRPSGWKLLTDGTQIDLQTLLDITRLLICK